MARPKHSILSLQLIAAAALRLVAKHGDFTIPGVAAALGVHPSSLYHHLPGGRLAIMHRMREELYTGIDLGPALDTSLAPLDGLRLWMRAYRAATARVPAVVPVLVGAPVEDLRTLEIYEALFVILRDAGAPPRAARRVLGDDRRRCARVGDGCGVAGAAVAQQGARTAGAVGDGGSAR